MNGKIYRVGTIYIPVRDPYKSASWYQKVLGAVVNFQDEQKTILDFANQSVFLVKAKADEKLNFTDANGYEHFTVTFEVNGEKELEDLHNTFKEGGVKIGDIEDRGHPGRNFIFYDLDGNKFDVWSELSPDYIKRYNID
ncbi:glyoxalase [Virgibacillus phasianinus]|uniref:Glyoxalase n=1 Tax=Virgibacillus phasianinus TaxID=2017483 RepID=A0A220TZ20_9BACI|nr:VOC family protein [Virgibacillus phasianinus]ASK60995.1 glyoxalase [Virgibacillus phasianinus]